MSDPPLPPESERVLLDLLDVAAPSGFEEPAAERWLAHASSIGAQVRTSRIGTAFATVNAGRGPRVAIVGHLDEIGLVITRVDGDGFCRVTSIGGWDPVVLPGQRLRILTTGGDVVGTVSRTAVHVLDQAARGRAPKVDELWVDIGASDRASALEVVSIGDPAVIDASPTRIGGAGSTRLVSRALDNRVGLFVAFEVARIAAERELAVEVVAVGSVGEEIGMGGAMAAVYELRPDRTCVVDVTTPSDTPGAGELGTMKLGKGPVVTRGSSLTAWVVEELVAAADAAEIPIQLRAKGLRTATDADQTVRAGRGVATCLVNVPGRYLHTPVEQVDLLDVRATIDLLVAWVERVAESGGGRG